MNTPELTPQPAGGGCHRGGQHRHGFRFGRVLFITALAVAAGFAGGYASKSFAHGPHGMMSPMSATMDPAQSAERIERMIKHFAVEADATPEQRQRLTVIATDAARDMAPLRDKLKSARTQGIALMGAPVIDRAAIEKLRAEQIALADTSSRRLTQALADAADVLTPEQRAKLAERAKKFGERRGWMKG